MADEPQEPQEPQLPEQDATKLAMLAEIEQDIPEGVRNFLTTELPDGPTLTAPVDVETAIICQAEFCVWMGQMFGQFKGLTPIQIPMMIGQLNTVQHSMLLSALEVAQPTEEAPGLLTILDPKDGASYLPGELRVRASADKDLVRDVTAQLGETDPFSLRDVEGDVWRNYLDLDLGEYTLTVSATLCDEDAYTEDMGELTQSVTFTIAEDAEEPAEGADEEAVQEVESKIKEALDALADQSVLDVPAYAGKWLNVLKTQFGVYKTIAGQVLEGDAEGVVNTLITEAKGVIENFEENIQNPDEEADPLSMGRILNFAFKIKNLLNL